MKFWFMEMDSLTEPIRNREPNSLNFSHDILNSKIDRLFWTHIEWEILSTNPKPETRWCEVLEWIHFMNRCGLIPFYFLQILHNLQIEIWLFFILFIWIFFDHFSRIWLFVHFYVIKWQRFFEFHIFRLFLPKPQPRLIQRFIRPILLSSILFLRFRIVFAATPIEFSFLFFSIPELSCCMGGFMDRIAGRECCNLLLGYFLRQWIKTYSFQF